MWVRMWVRVCVSSPLTVRRLRLAAEPTPILLGGSVYIWERWTYEFSKIPGGLYVLWSHLPVRVDEHNDGASMVTVMVILVMVWPGLYIVLRKTIFILLRRCSSFGCSGMGGLVELF